MKVLIMTVGLPASGKSTWCKGFKNSFVISYDGIRKQLYGDESVQGNFAEIEKEFDKQVKMAVRSYEYIVLDATNIYQNRRKEFIKKWKKYFDEFWAVQFPLTVDECKERNKQRERQVPESVIDRMDKNMQWVERGEGFHAIWTIWEDSSKEDGYFYDMNYAYFDKF